METIQMTPYSRPGLNPVNVPLIVNLICDSFNLKDLAWIKSKCREDKVRIPRQVLMCCLIEFANYSHREAGNVCDLDHATAYHAKKVVNDTLLNDKLWGERVRKVYDECWKTSKAHEKQWRVNS